MGELLVQVYGKESCGKCAKAKQALRRMRVPFTAHDLPKAVEHHDGWREDDSVDLLAAYWMIEGDMPVIKIGSEYHGYSSAIKRLKELSSRDAAAVEG